MQIRKDSITQLAHLLLIELKPSLLPIKSLENPTVPIKAMVRGDPQT